jgi:hypothetical protein
VGTPALIAGLCFLLISNAASLLAASAVSSRLRTGKLSVDLLLTLVIRLLLISALILVAGVCRCLTSAHLGIACLAALLGLFGMKAHRHLGTLSGLSIPRQAWIVLAIGGLVLLRALAQAWFFAPYNFDSLSYHLTKIPEWIRAGGFTREMGPDTHATFPAGFELVETWWVVFLHHDVLIEMAGVEFLILATLAVYVLAEAFGLAPRSGVPTPVRPESAVNTFADELLGRSNGHSQQVI